VLTASSLFDPFLQKAAHGSDQRKPSACLLLVSTSRLLHFVLFDSAETARASPRRPDQNLQSGALLVAKPSAHPSLFDRLHHHQVTALSRAREHRLRSFPLQLEHHFLPGCAQFTFQAPRSLGDPRKLPRQKRNVTPRQANIEFRGHPSEISYFPSEAQTRPPALV
jgi:hypothetical protein